MTDKIDNSNYFVSNRDITVSSVLGHTLEFKRGAPLYVPKIMHKEVIEKGILPADQDGKADADKAGEVLAQAEAGPKVVLSPEDPAEREEAIAVACKAIAQRNASSDFTGGGTPSAAAVSAALGYKVDQKEVKQVWSEIKPNLNK